MIPHPMSVLGLLLIEAVIFKAVRICMGSQSGWAWINSAQAPATRGAANDVLLDEMSEKIKMVIEEREVKRERERKVFYPLIAV